MIKTKVTFDEVAEQIRQMDNFNMANFTTCIAGAAMLAAGYHQETDRCGDTYFMDDGNNIEYASVIGDRLLGFEVADCFLLGCWPLELQKKYIAAKSVHGRQEAAIEALRLELEKQS